MMPDTGKPRLHNIPPDTKTLTPDETSKIRLMLSAGMSPLRLSKMYKVPVALIQDLDRRGRKRGG